MKVLMVFAVLVLAVPRMDRAAADSQSCSGSVRCKLEVSVSDCDAALRMIVPGNNYFVGGSKGSTGVCAGTCGMFVQGSLCSLTGQQMIDDVNALRNHGCQKCGIYTYDNGCQFKIDYVTGC